MIEYSPVNSNRMMAAVIGAEHRADEQRGREDPAGPADPDGQARGHDLADEKQRQEAECVPTLDALLQYRVAHPVHLRQGEEEEAEEESAGDRAQPFWLAPPRPVAGIFHGVESFCEPDRNETCREPEHYEESELRRIDDGEGRQGKKRMIAEDRPTDDGGCNRRENNDAERSSREVTKEEFEGEEHAGDGSVEGCGDGTGGTARHQGSQLRLRHSDRASEG